MAVALTINGATIEAAPGVSIFDCAERLGVRVPTSCQKQGKCKECMVEVSGGMECLSALAEPERHLAGNFRLSCSTKLVAETGRVTCHTMRRGQMRIESCGADRQVCGRSPDRPSAERDLEVPRRPGGPPHKNGYGIAMDLGTTTIVLRLYNLANAELVAAASFENPQRFGGSDVMARIHYDTTHPGKLLRRTLAGYLRHAIEDFPVPPEDIREMVVVGNSTMRDIFFRQNVYSIGQSPYRSITEIEMAEGKRATTSLVETGRRCLLPMHPEATVYGAPIISGHVGADAAACMLAVDLAKEERLVAIMDIGTNTELILGNRDRILAASCPAGPAFEGGAIACGMPALDGAIEDVRIGGRGPGPGGRDEFHLTVIGGGDPIGLCGSGLIALLGELLRTGRMNERGRFEDDVDRIDLAPKVYFLESDVNELAQAKGANAAGLKVACDRYGCSFDDIEVFYLAGGFGRHVDINAALRIGLIPSIPIERIVQIGNAAIEGASMILLSEDKRHELEETVLRVEHCRLETHPQFFDFFVDGCLFQPAESAYGIAG